MNLNEQLDEAHPLWTESQVNSLNGFQKSGVMHPFTCGNCRNDLVATPNCWECPTDGCDYKQDWAHDFMADWSWLAQWLVMRAPKGAIEHYAMLVAARKELTAERDKLRADRLDLLSQLESIDQAAAKFYPGEQMLFGEATSRLVEDAAKWKAELDLLKTLIRYKDEIDNFKVTPEMYDGFLRKYRDNPERAAELIGVSVESIRADMEKRDG